jgi:hypothetical protein
MKTNKCLFCQETLQGRSDKKFCNDQCKSAYHNQQPKSSEIYIKTINRQLRANRSALRKACPLGKATVRIDFLKQLGMDLKYYTHTWKSRSNITYYFCYDYGYTQSTETGKVLIVQQQDYMKR